MGRVGLCIRGLGTAIRAGTILRAPSSASAAAQRVPVSAPAAFFALITSALLAVRAIAAPGALDLSFGTGGFTLTNIQHGNSGQGYALAIQSDGKIVVAGSGYNGENDDFALVRYNLDGSPDRSFGGDGIVTTYSGSDDEYASAVAVQSDGRIVAAGASMIVRYNADGGLDADFGVGGIVATDSDLPGTVNAMQVQDDGKILVAGNVYAPSGADFALARYNPDGSLDTSFGEDGVVITDVGIADNVSAVAIQPDGRIVAAGASMIVRYNADGGLDADFGVGGIVATDSDLPGTVNAMQVQDDGKILVAGNAYAPSGIDVALARYNPDGSLDTSLDDDGIVATEFDDYIVQTVQSVAVQSDGKIVVAGSALGFFDARFNEDIAVVRYNPNGSVDADFGDDGIVTTSIADGSDEAARAVVVQANGAIVVTGFGVDGDSVYGWYSGVVAVRYNPDSSLDGDFGDDGVALTLPGDSSESASDLAIRSDGKIVVAVQMFSERDSPSGAVVRYGADGLLDPSFDEDGIVSSNQLDLERVHTIAIQADDKMLIGGSKSGVGRVLGRFDPDGTLDSSFGESGFVVGAYSVVAVQPDGKIITAVETGVARRNADGSLDTSFGESGVITTTFGGAVAIQSDAKVVVAGTTPDGESTNIAVARYNPNGSLDPDFGVDGVVLTDFFEGGYDRSSALAIQADGKLVVAGDTHSENSENCYQGCYVILRYDADGSVDENFGEGGAALTNANYGGRTSGIAIQGDGKIILTATQENSEDEPYGSDVVVGRYNGDGSPDVSFGFDGRVGVDLVAGDDGVSCMGIQSDGKIVWAGGTSGPRGDDIALVRHLVTDCGDGQSEPGEGCDDGNTRGGDGCSAGCVVETGWSCDGAASVCWAVHGDGVIVGDEECDDGNVDGGDGCSANGNIETGYKCVGEPSVCTWGCGDGDLDAGEECDDGNTLNGDGCSSLCEVQQRCGDANDDGKHSASDAVSILKAAIGIDVICPTWICDVDNQAGPKATDALTVLNLSVGLPATLQCGQISALVFRLMDPVVVAGFNATVDLNDIAGALVGVGASVECESLINGVAAVFNRPDVVTLRIGYVDLDGIAGPRSLARCAFVPIGRVLTTDIVVSVVDAVDVFDNELIPPPRLDAIPY